MPRPSPDIATASRLGASLRDTGKHVCSQSPVELSLGVDVSSGEDWQAASVEWHPWDETGEDVWVHIQITVRASGETLTIFLRGYHPFAVQGSATLFDAVRVVDLGHQKSEHDSKRCRRSSSRLLDRACTLGHNAITGQDCWLGPSCLIYGQTRTGRDLHIVVVT